jgi:hypothetical protein
MDTDTFKGAFLTMAQSRLDMFCHNSENKLISGNRDRRDSEDKGKPQIKRNPGQQFVIQ